MKSQDYLLHKLKSKMHKKNHRFKTNYVLGLNVERSQSIGVNEDGWAGLPYLSAVIRQESCDTG